MRKFVLLLLAFSITGSAKAYLGDSGDRIEDLYENLVQRHLREDGTVSMLYRKDRYLYFVVFKRQVSVLERYCRVDRKDLSDREISRFLKANTGGQRGVTWVRDSVDRSKFVRSDHKAVAELGIWHERSTLLVRAPAEDKTARQRDD